MISGETTGCRKVIQILRYMVPNKFLSQQKEVYHWLLLLFPFRDKRQSLSDFPPIYQDKLRVTSPRCCKHGSNQS